jgi:hypothetical protein
MASNAKYKSQIKKFIKVAANTGTKEIRGAALAIGLTGVVNKSIVDEGTFKGNWVVSLNSVNLEVDEFRVDKNGGITIAKGGSVIARFKLGDTIWITNNLPYGNKMEFVYGAAPIRRTLVELESHFKSRNKKV